MRFRYIIEGQDAVAQFAEEVGAEGYQEPEGQLIGDTSAKGYGVVGGQKVKCT